MRRGVELITAMARAAREFFPTEHSIFGAISEYDRLSKSAEQFRIRLAQCACLFEIQSAITPLVTLYPRCPLSLVGPSASQQPESYEPHLQAMRAIVSTMFDKADRETVMTTATFIWLAFDSGKLKVQRGLVLADFPEIEHYPHTEVSRKIASGIRAGINMFFGNEDRPLSGWWPDYFWNRGLEIDRCMRMEIELG